MLLPDLRKRMCAVTACLIGDWKQYETSSFHPFYFAFGDAELGRINLIVGRVDSDKTSFNALKFRSRIVIARGVELIKHVVGVPALHGSPLLIVE